MTFQQKIDKILNPTTQTSFVPTVQLCCCQTRILNGHKNCEKHDVTGSSHTCSVTGKLVSG